MEQQKGASTGLSSGATAGSSRVPITLSEQQWTALAPLVPGGDASSRGRLADPRRVVEGILYAIRNGIGMQSVPPPYPSGSTLYRRYTAWTVNGQWDAIWDGFLDTLSRSDRQQWEAAAERRAGASGEGAVEQTELAAPPQADATPAVAEAPARVVTAEAPVVVAAASSEVGVRRNQAPSVHVPPEPVAVSEPPAPASSLTAEAARERVAERLRLSAAESQIVSRRIDDHGVAAALLALDETERRLATGSMRGVGGMPMSAFEIWVCAVGLARRPVERPRPPKPERNDRQEIDHERRKRQWRKSP